MYQHPAVQEACIIGSKDAHRGETVKAVIVPRAEWRDRIEAQAIIDWCREHMAAYKVPRIIEFVDSLPNPDLEKFCGASCRATRERKMKALLSRQPGGPETLTLEEIPDPNPGTGEVRIGRARRGGQFPRHAHHSGSVSNQAAAAVLRPAASLRAWSRMLGEGITTLKVGDRVLVSPVRSAMAEKAIASAGNCWKIPDAMPFDEAAALLMTYGTSQHALKDRAQLRVRRDIAGAGSCRRCRSRGG